MAPIDLCDTLVAVDEPSGEITLDAAWATTDRPAAAGCWASFRRLKKTSRTARPTCCAAARASTAAFACRW